MGQGDTLLNALIGAGVTVLLSFTGLSPVVGGGVAAYLQGGDRREGIRVGAISGAVATLPFLLLVSALLSFLGLFIAGGGRGALAIGALGFVFFLVIFVGALLWNVGLGAGGGYLAVYIAQEEGIGHYGARPQGAGGPHQGGQQPRGGQPHGGRRQQGGRQQGGRPRGGQRQGDRQQDDQWGSGGQQGGHGQRDDDRREY